MPVNISENNSIIKFIKDPVEPKNGSDFETSFITSNFEKNHRGIDIKEILKISQKALEKVILIQNTKDFDWELVPKIDITK